MATNKVSSAAKYDESDIDVLDFPEAIREKASYYIGSVDGMGVFTIVREALDNGVDEALAGRNTFTHLHISKTAKGENEYWILDKGAGIPVKPKLFKGDRIPAIELVLTKLHSSGKFTNSAYATSRGVHGLGVKTLNALSTHFEVWTHREDQWYHLGFQRGIKTADLKKCKSPLNPLTKKPLSEGTLIRAVPDPKIFKKTQSLSKEAVVTWANVSAFFTPKFKVLISDDKGNQKEIYHPNGPKDYVTKRLAKHDAAASPLSPAVFSYTNPMVDCVCQFTDFDGVDFAGFTNGLFNTDGGTHVSSFFQALKNSLNAQSAKKIALTVAEIQDGVIGLVNFKANGPQFTSQTKDKLSDERAGAQLQEDLTKEFETFFKGNKALATKIIDRSLQFRSLREKFLNDKKALGLIKKTKGKGFPQKAKLCPKAKPEDRELFICEGDSAMGSVAGARDPDYQEALPLKGRPQNALRVTASKLFGIDDKKKRSNSYENMAVNILTMIGFDPNSKDPYNNLRVGKVIALSDPDPDGPFHKDTELEVYADSKWQSVSVVDLAGKNWANKEYKVVAWNGKSYSLTEAYDCRVTEHSDQEVAIAFSDGYKVRVSPSHNFPVYTNKRDVRSETLLSNGMQMVPASKLKTGDRIMATPEGLSIGELFEPNVPMSFRSIVKIKQRTLDEAQPWYCLTVPGYHNFRLPSGIFSKNCHINSLILTLLFKFLPGLFDRGMVYAMDLPEFYHLSRDGKTLIGGSTTEDVGQKMKDAGLPAGGSIKHIKGLAEVDSSILNRLAFDPPTRLLRQILPTKAANGETEFLRLMSKDTDSRRELLGITE